MPRSPYAAVNERRRKRAFNRRSTGQLNRRRRENPEADERRRARADYKAWLRANSESILANARADSTKRFIHEERPEAFVPERIRTVTEPNGTEVRLGFRGDRSEVVSVLRPKARVTPAKGIERYMNEWVLYGGLPARRRDVIADARAQAERIAPGDRARQERLVGTVVLGAGDAIAPPDAIPEGPTAFDVRPLTTNGPVRRIVPVRRSRRARAHPRRLK